MRTSDRTYQSKLGFSDPDRHNETHNAAAIYLSAPDQLRKFVDFFDLKYVGFDWTEWEPITFDVNNRAPGSLSMGYIPLKWEFRKKVAPSEVSSKYEINMPITHSSGNYKNIIGYLDLYIYLRTSQIHNIEYRVTNLDEALASYKYKDPPFYRADEEDAKKEFLDKTRFSNSFEDAKSIVIAIEVKHGFSDVSSVVQQISTYRQFFNAEYILCTTYKVNNVYKRILRDHNITHIYVDPLQLKEFMSEQSNEPEESF